MRRTSTRAYHLLVVDEHRELVTRADAHGDGRHVGFGAASVWCAHDDAITSSDASGAAHHQLVPAGKDRELVPWSHAARHGHVELLVGPPIRVARDRVSAGPSGWAGVLGGAAVVSVVVTMGQYTWW